jgi:hypothetical protein
MSPSLGGQGGSYLKPRECLVTISFRTYRAFRDYQGSTALPVPSPPDIYAKTRVNLLDVAVTRALTNRFSLSFEMPVLWASRETYAEHDFVSPHTMRSRGLGDARVIGNVWLLHPDQHEDQNLALKLGVKIPIGRNDAKDYSYRETGPVLRPVDPAIQPATGGWGILFGAQGFKRFSTDTSVYFDGIYLSNPLEMNGVESPYGDRPEITQGDIGYQIASVSDQFLTRIGFSQSVPQLRGLSVNFGLRTDGVRARDFIGGSDGYRIAGYSVSVDPGLSFSWAKNFVEVTFPITVKGHGSKSLADIRTNSPYAGIATIADSQFIVGVSRRF